MKSKVSKKPTRGILSPSLTVSPLQVSSLSPSGPHPLTSDLCHLPSGPASFNLFNPFNDLTTPPHRYSLRKHRSFWSLTFNGQEACFDHEQGAFYVAWLLLNPPPEPIHGMALELKASAYFRQLTGETIFIDPISGRTIPLPSDAMLVQRNLAADDLEAAYALHREIRKLEALLEDEDVIEPVKAEVTRELEAIYAFQKKNPVQITDQAQKAVRSVREAIRHLHQNLATAYTPEGNPHAILRQFAFHLQRNLLIPSARYSQVGRGRGRTRAGVAGSFTYEPPEGIEWTA